MQTGFWPHSDWRAKPHPVGYPRHAAPLRALYWRWIAAALPIAISFAAPSRPDDRPVLCVGGPGPFDHTAALILAQLLENAGIRVRLETDAGISPLNVIQLAATPTASRRKRSPDIATRRDEVLHARTGEKTGRLAGDHSCLPAQRYSIATF